MATELAAELVPRASPSYLPWPYSVDPLPEDLRRGLLPVGIFAMLSVISTLALLGWITYRLVAWRKHYKTYVGYNQYVLLIYNLLLADLQQSLSFIISFHWIEQNSMLAPSDACYAQAWLVQIGDVSSGMFVFAIALHTFFSVVKGRQLPFRTFLICTICIWIAAVAVSVLGPILNGRNYFAVAGAWCWVAEKYEVERLWLHYIWIFVVEFGTVVIYALIFFYLRKQLANIVTAQQSATQRKVTKAASYMVVYPVTYVLLTLPLAAGRMAAMTGRTLPTTYYCVAGTMMTSCGWVDALLYTLTRRVLVSDELDPRKSSSARNGYGTGYGQNSTAGGWEITSFDKSAGGVPGVVDHTVTITGGKDARGSTFVDLNNLKKSDGVHVSTTERGRSKQNAGANHFHHGSSSTSVRDPSPHGSTDTMIRGGDLGGLMSVRADTKVEVTVERAENYLLSSESSSGLSTPKTTVEVAGGDGGRRSNSLKNRAFDFR